MGRRVRIKPRRRMPKRAGPAGRCETTGKLRYLSKGHALSAALKRATTGGKPLRAYHCPDCGDYHLTSRPQRRTDDRQDP